MAPFRFVFMADCQLGCYATFSGMDDADVARFAARNMRVRTVPRAEGFEWDACRYERAVDAATQLRPEFVVMGGDMVDDPSSLEQFAELLRITGRLDGIPMHWVPGNHDAAPDAVRPTAASLRRYRRRFGSDTYAFDHLGVACIVVNTVVWQHPELVPDEWATQLAFLEMALRTARDRHRRHILVFGHHPLFTRVPEEPDSYWNIPLDRRGPILDLLVEYGVRAFFCGHWHRNGGGWDRDLEVVVTGPVGYPLGDDPSGFRIVDVDDDRVGHRYVPLPVGDAADTANTADTADAGDGAGATDGAGRG
jgi:serine/threonine-protein phosphatase CPPED1